MKRKSIIAFVALAICGLTAFLIYWNARVTQHSEFTWFDSTKQARLSYLSSGGDVQIGTAYNVTQALDILAQKGWKLVSTRPAKFGTVYVISRTGLETPGTLSVNCTLNK